MTELCREYGEGLYALCAEENIVEDVLGQMETLSRCLREQPDFIRLLGNMSLPKAERLAILDGALRGQVHPYLLNFTKLLCERGMLWDFDGCAEVCRGLYYRDAGITEAFATTGVPLSADQKERLAKKLSEMSGRKVLLREKVDPAVMGGVMLEMDGKRYDNTVRHQLAGIWQAMNRESD